MAEIKLGQRFIIRGTHPHREGVQEIRGTVVGERVVLLGGNPRNSVTESEVELVSGYKFWMPNLIFWAIAEVDNSPPVH